MKISQILLIGATALATFATPAFAQSEDEYWEGAYIGGSIGIGAQSNDRNESVVFDTDGDGAFDNSVNTILATDAFAPGFCGGASNGTHPAFVAAHRREPRQRMAA